MIDHSKYTYNLPANLIANQPANPRDNSKLLVYDTIEDKISLDRFYHLDRYLPPKSFLVLNNTKVIPARITLYKYPQGLSLQGGGGGKVKVLFLVNEELLNNTIRGYVDRKVSVGDRLYFDRFYYINTIKQEGSIFTFQLNFSLEKLFEFLEKKGTMPIPLYIKNTPLDEKELRKKYQTIFAQVPSGTCLTGGSAAAPTASLHFTNRLFSKLEKKGIRKFFITLHVGLGTFAPIDKNNIKEKKLHEEYYEVDRQILQYNIKLKQSGYKLVAVGTTVVRTLESLIWINRKTEDRLSECQTDQMIRCSGFRNSVFSHQIYLKTDLFIFPPYDFQMVDCLITNFHLPKSSLMMLVEAFLQFKKSKKHLVDLYKIAIKNSFRFYSFGDVMLII